MQDLHCPDGGQEAPVVVPPRPSVIGYGLGVRVEERWRQCKSQALWPLVPKAQWCQQPGAALCQRAAGAGFWKKRLPGSWCALNGSRDREDVGRTLATRPSRVPHRRSKAVILQEGGHLLLPTKGTYARKDTGGAAAPTPVVGSEVLTKNAQPKENFYKSLFEPKF